MNLSETQISTDAVLLCRMRDLQMWKCMCGWLNACFGQPIIDCKDFAINGQNALTKELFRGSTRLKNLTTIFGNTQGSNQWTLRLRTYSNQMPLLAKLSSKL